MTQVVRNQVVRNHPPYPRALARIAFVFIVYPAYRRAIGQAAKVNHPNRSKFRCKNTSSGVTLRIYIASNYSLEPHLGVCSFLRLA